ncbi:MAG: aldo/keto reductase [Eggerthellaceae bacterium]|nr:aldo/keto reductase [Eggerthellaceae bacterium]
MAYLGEEIGKLGFGLMRLPRNEDGSANMELICQLVDRFLEAGFTYFDTAWIYGDSEAITAEALVKRHPRESYQLATKGISWIGCKTPEDAQAHFYQSLERTGAGYFDFYLLHMTGGVRTQVFDNLGMWDFVMEKKAEGLIRHIGFSHHGNAAELDEILTAHPETEFVQLQVNYLDWEDPVNEGRKSMEVAAKHGVPVVVMEPLRGGLLANPPASVAQVLKDADPEASCASWAMRFVASQPNIITVLSGMNAMDQLEDNIASMSDLESFGPAETAVVEAAQAEFAKFNLIPCTACNYCSKVCPENVAISGSFITLNANILFGRHVQEWINWNGGGKKPSACIECHACEDACPQGISIVDELKRAKEIIG